MHGKYKRQAQKKKKKNKKKKKKTLKQIHKKESQAQGSRLFVKRRLPTLPLAQYHRRYWA